MRGAKENELFDPVGGVEFHQFRKGIDFNNIPFLTGARFDLKLIVIVGERNVIPVALFTAGRFKKRREEP